MVTIGDLRKLIENQPDDMEIGGVVHFGEALTCYGISIVNVDKYRSRSTEKKTILCISIEYAGDIPD